MVPPHARDVDGVPGFEFAGARVFQRVRETRVGVEIGVVEIDEADRLPGRREIDRADVEVRELVGRKQREAAVAGADAGDVLGDVVVRGNARAVADPDSHGRLDAVQFQAVGRPDSRQAVSQRHRAHVDDG